MAREFALPDPGEGIHEAEIVSVEVSPDDTVEESQVLMEVETDKAVVEVPAPFSGRVTEVLVEVGDRVEVGEPVLRYEEAGSEDGDEAGGREKAVGEEREAAERRGEVEGEEAEGASRQKPGDEKGDAAEEPAGEESRAGRPVPAAPATRRLARELGVDLRSVDPSGPEDRVTPEDVRAAAEGEAAGEGPEEPPAAEAPEREAAEEAEEPEGAAGGERQAEAERAGTAAGAETSDAERWGSVRREPLRSVRRTTAERTSRSWARIPHVTHMDVADITELDAFRARQTGPVDEAGGDLSLSVFLLKAAVAALKEFPRFNAHFDDERQEIVFLEYHSVGMAVDTDRGLLVPVVRDVDSKSLTELAVETSRLVQRARDGKLERDDMRGGSFTLTNPGPIGGTAFTPIINPPQVAILGAARADWQAAVVEDDEGERRVEPRKMLPLCLAFDHRVNDGADGARFVRRLVEILESPDAFVRNL